MCDFLLKINEKIKKKGANNLLIVLIVLLILLAVAATVLYSLVYGGKNYDSVYEKRASSGEIINPAKDLTLEEGIAQFNESFVYFLLYSIKAYNLHEAPLSEDKPQIEIFIEDGVYSAYVEKGEIYVSNQEIEKEDIIIYTTKEEAVKMIQNKEYIEQSFQEEKSTIEAVSDKTVLATKGYLELYTELTGKSITGAFIFGVM